MQSERTLELWKSFSRFTKLEMMEIAFSTSIMANFIEFMGKLVFDSNKEKQVEEMKSMARIILIIEAMKWKKEGNEGREEKYRGNEEENLGAIYIYMY